jgi:hypothetical protein
MACEAAVVMRRRSVHVIKARRALEAFYQEAGSMTVSVLLRGSVQPPLGIGGGSIYVAKTDWNVRRGWAGSVAGMPVLSQMLGVGEQRNRKAG